MADWQWFTRMHRWVYENSDGRIGANLAGRPMIMLYTIGRKSGQVRPVPLMRYDILDDGPIVLASNNGNTTPPAWWLNLQARPTIEVRTGRECWQATAEEVHGELREQVWEEMTAVNPIIRRYARTAARTIPIVLLRRAI